MILLKVNNRIKTDELKEYMQEIKAVTEHYPPVSFDGSHRVDYIVNDVLYVSVYESILGYSQIKYISEE